MEWKNIGLIRAKNLDSKKFTTDAGIKFRRIVYPALDSFRRSNVDKPIVTLKYPVLDANTPYIFAAGHYFPGEIASNVAAIDRNAYVLLGTTDQIDHNPQMYGAWINGMIYVNKLDKNSRKESMKKMERILNSGTSIIMYPEGVLNNTENLYCVSVYPGFYHLAQATNCLVVPIMSHTELSSDKIFFAANDPIDFSNKSKKESLIELRDNLSTLRYFLSQIENQTLLRDDLTGDLHQKHMEERKKVYNGVKWTRDVWDEEIMTYKEPGITTPQEIRESFDNVKITKDNAAIFGPILVKRLEDKKYDFKQYMKENWDK